MRSEMREQKTTLTLVFTLSTQNVVRMWFCCSNRFSHPAYTRTLFLIRGPWTSYSQTLLRFLLEMKIIFLPAILGKWSQSHRSQQRLISKFFSSTSLTTMSPDWLCKTAGNDLSSRLCGAPSWVWTPLTNGIKPDWRGRGCTSCIKGKRIPPVFPSPLAFLDWGVLFQTEFLYKNRSVCPCFSIADWPADSAQEDEGRPEVV